MRELERKRDTDLAQKRRSLQILTKDAEVDEGAAPVVGQACTPAKPSRVIRLSLRTLSEGS
jgi:hypothetical protein